MIIVDLRDDLMEKDEALGLFVVLLELFAAAIGDEQFNKLVVLMKPINASRVLTLPAVSSRASAKCGTRA